MLLDWRYDGSGLEEQIQMAILWLLRLTFMFSLLTNAAQ